MSDQDDFDGPAITRGRPPERPAAKPKKDITPMKLAAIAVAVVLVALAWMFRWEVTPVPTASVHYGTAYLLDRWTGTLYAIGGSSKLTVKLED